MATIQPYLDQGNFTQFHNANFDHIMPIVSSSAWKILCLIIRKTKGWQKDEDDIAYSQLKAGTGIKSDATISRAIKELLELGVIQVGKAVHQADPHAYRLNKSYSCRTSKNEDSTPKKWSTTTSKNEDTKETNQNKDLNKSIAATPPPTEPSQKSKPQKQSPIPSEIDTPSFRDMWEQWKLYKGKSIKVMTYNRQLTRAAREAHTHGIDKVIALYNLTMDNGWQGVPWDRLQKSGNYQNYNAPKTQKQLYKEAPAVVGEF